MARHFSTRDLISTSSFILAALCCVQQSARAQYTWVTDTDNSASWAGPANWTSATNDYPNAVGATALMVAPLTVRSTNPTANYTIALPAAQNITVGQIKIDNTNFPNNYNVSFTQGAELDFQMNAADPTIQAQYIETPGSAAGGSTRYTFNQVIRALSDLDINQQNIVSLNTGTTFTGIIDGDINRKIIKDGDGGIQFNANLSLLTGEGFLGEYIINGGGIRLLGNSAIAKSKAITVNSGGQLQLADNASTAIPDYSMATAAPLNLNGAGKNAAVSGIATPEGALRIGIQTGRTTTFHNPVVLQSDSVISVPTTASIGVLDQPVTGSGSLIKHGLGELVLSNAGDAYTGDTKFMAASSGTLSFSSPVLADNRDVYLTMGSILDLNYSATDTIRSLFIDGVGQVTGTWGSTTSTATNKTPLISGNGLLQVSVLPTTGVPGDFNGNGVVDMADYVLWRNGGPLLNEVSDPGVVTAQDYADWRAHFGNTAGAGSGLASSSAVPEPAAIVLALYGFSTLLLSSRKR
jgi:hypothetical protein